MKRWVARAALAAALMTPWPAFAHLVNSGLGPFYDGALHLLLSPGDLLGLVAVALLAGLRGPRAGRLTVIVLPLAWLLAGLLGLRTSMPLDLTWLSTLSFVSLGLLVALDARIAPWVVALLAGGYATLQGVQNGATLAAIGAGAVTLSGIVLAVLMIALLTAAAVVPLRVLWSRTLVRVAGSWIVAVGMLMLGWTLKGVT
jgi:hydrogenase/urease accessory protein HupE